MPRRNPSSFGRPLPHVCPPEFLETLGVEDLYKSPGEVFPSGGPLPALEDLRPATALLTIYRASPLSLHRTTLTPSGIGAFSSPFSHFGVVVESMAGKNWASL